MEKSSPSQKQPVVMATTRAIIALVHTDKSYYKFYSKGLGVRVHPRPSSSNKPALKTFCHYYTKPGEKHKTFITLGHFNPEKKGSRNAKDLTLEEAFAKNQEIIEKLKQGIDPRASKRGAVSFQSTGDVNSEGGGDDTKEKPFEDMTIADLVTDYLKFVKKNKAPATYRHYSDTLNTFILKPWKTRCAKDIKKSDAYQLVKKIAARVKNNGDTTEGMARAVIKVCSAMFAWKITKEDDSYINAFEKVKAIEEVEIIMYSSKKPPRALDDKEIETFWDTANSPDGPGSSSAVRALMLELLTGQRPGECCGMHRKEIKNDPEFLKKIRIHSGDPLIDDVGAWWVVPWQRIKTRGNKKKKKNETRDHLVYLSPLALLIIGDSDGYIFPSPDAEKNGASITASTLSHLVRDEEEKIETKRKKGALPQPEPKPKYFGVDVKWTPNDLRKTARTKLAEIGCPREIAERILNHSVGRIEGTYNLYEYAAQKKFWLTKLSDHIEGLVSKKPLTADDVRLSDETYDVEELRKLVKEKPLTTVGKILGISDNGVRKRCAKHGINLPLRGRHTS